jgi:hypothetical protein
MGDSEQRRWATTTSSTSVQNPVLAVTLRAATLAAPGLLRALGFD